MPTAPWTYEIPPAASDAVGLEDYTVESARGEYVGKVKAVLRHGSETYVAVEGGTPPLTHALHAVRWENVREVDHGAVTVRLDLTEEELAAELELASSNAVEGGSAEAVRVTELPPELSAPSAPEAPGPVDRPTYAWLLVAALTGVFSALVLALFATTREFTWEFGLFVVPLALLAAAGVLAYRFFRRPSGPA
ncbi:MAG TPA: hypothetical protein VHF23_01250 [Gaiellaceae bacterium]|nr:hypothetical protein [Gaiellaceae bacterium]